MAKHHITRQHLFIITPHFYSHFHVHVYRLTRLSLVGLPAPPLLLLPTLSLLRTLDMSELLPVEVRRAKTSIGLPGVWCSLPRWNCPRRSDQGAEGGGEPAMVIVLI